MNEIWKIIPSYPDYEASTLGRIRRKTGGSRNTKVGRILKHMIHYKGYVRVDLGAKAKGKRVHHLILEAFVGPRPEGKQTNHINGIKSDNRLVNLEWVTPQQNVRHSFDKLGHKALCGIQLTQSKLTENDVLQIREWASFRWKQAMLAQAWNITAQTISHIVNRKTWKHL